MPYQSSYGVCDDNTLSPHYDPSCTDLPEKGRIRRGAWVHSSVYDAIAASPTTGSLWTSGINSGKVIILPQLSGSFDGGTPKLVPGYGDQKEQYSGSDFKATLKDPEYKRNWAHYYSLVGKSTWYLCYLTETQAHLTSNPVTVAPKNPITENIEDSVIWESEVTWFEFFTPKPFTPPANIFISIPVVTTFDTSIVTASSATPAAAFGVTATATATNANQKFEFNKITSTSGLPDSMTIHVGSTDELVVDFPADYLGQAFKYTDKANTVHTGVFTNGTVTY